MPGNTFLFYIQKMLIVDILYFINNYVDLSFLFISGHVVEFAFTKLYTI